MKKFFVTTLAVGITLAAAADMVLNIRQGAVTYINTSFADEDIPVNNGVMTVGQSQFSLLQGDKIWYSNDTYTPNTIIVKYDNDTATVTADGALASTVSVTVDNADVTVNQGDVTDEVTYILTGESADGSFTLNGSYKATVQLNNITLTSAKGAAIDIENGKRIKINVPSGTISTLADAANGSQKGCLYAKGHLEFTGKGALTVTGNKGHAIAAKEYVTLKNISLTVTSAVKDGINCAQYFAQESGSITISGVGDDCIQVDYKDAENREAEDTGSFTITGGSMNLTTSATASKCIKTEGNVTIDGGEIIAEAHGEGKWDDTKLKTKAAACISSDENVYITNGTLTLSADKGGGKGISADGNLTMDGGTINITTSGGVYAYINGKEYTNYTGNTDNINSDYRSSAKGIKIDGDVVINGGEINIKTTGNGAEGIESKSTLTVNGGTIDINSHDDGINSSSHMYINGGDITVIATNNDALDSNGNLYINGGVIRACGPGSPEGGIDANEEEGYTVIITGGTLLAAGGNNSTPTTSESTQPFLSPSITLTSGQTITIKDGDTVLATVTVPEGYNSSSTGGGSRPGGGFGQGGKNVILSCPGLVNGNTYTIAYGNGTTTATATLRGSSSGRPW